MKTIRYFVILLSIVSYIESSTVETGIIDQMTQKEFPNDSITDYNQKMKDIFNIVIGAVVRKFTEDPEQNEETSETKKYNTEISKIFNIVKDMVIEKASDELGFSRSNGVFRTGNVIYPVSVSVLATLFILIKQ